MSGRKTERLTPKDWEWFDRNRGRPGEDYVAMEFAALLDRARDDIVELEARTSANCVSGTQ